MIEKRWGSAADTVAECATEADARSSEPNTTTVHRYEDTEDPESPSPWLEDDGQIWDGDGQIMAIEVRRFRAEREAMRYHASTVHTLHVCPRCSAEMGWELDPSVVDVAGSVVIDKRELARLRTALERIRDLALEDFEGRPDGESHRRVAREALEVKP